MLLLTIMLKTRWLTDDDKGSDTAQKAVGPCQPTGLRA